MTNVNQAPLPRLSKAPLVRASLVKRRYIKYLALPFFTFTSRCSSPVIHPFIMYFGLYCYHYYYYYYYDTGGCWSVVRLHHVHWTHLCCYDVSLDVWCSLHDRVLCLRTKLRKCCPRVLATAGDRGGRDARPTTILVTKSD